METASNRCDDVVLVYTRLIRLESHEAADAIEEICAAFGSHAALRAALIIMIMKMDAQQDRWIPNISFYIDLVEDYPAALPLMKYAMTCCLLRWAVSVIETGRWPELAAAQA